MIGSRGARLAVLAILLGGGVLGAPAPFGADTDAQDNRLTEALWSQLRGWSSPRRPKVALVLSGGGARGLSHIGVLQILEREKIPVDLIVGTSVGAIVGALYASGVPPAEIENMSREIGWDKLTDLSAAALVRLLVSEELLSTRNMERFLERRIGKKQFADLKIPLACVSADLQTGEQITLREGDVALAARASATMPGVFAPVPYRHRLLVDGGIVDNVPTDVAQRLGADVILCVNAPVDLARHSVANVFMTLTQALYIQGQVITEERIRLADALIEPRVEDVSTLELWKSPQCVQAGRAAAEAALPAVRRALVKKFLERWAER